MLPVIERLKIEHLGSLDFLVDSEFDKEERYKIDMAENEGNGKCSCSDFSTRCMPELRHVQRITEYGQHNRTRCKHINAVLIWIGNESIRRTIQ